jgi:hypothetical protein
MTGPNETPRAQGSSVTGGFSAVSTALSMVSYSLFAEPELKNRADLSCDLPQAVQADNPFFASTAVLAEYLTNYFKYFF